MKYTRTQVYLDPADHAALSEEAKRQGKSLTALLREVVALHVHENVAAYRRKGFEDLVGCIQDAEPTDMAADARAEMRAAFDERAERTLGTRAKRGEQSTRKRRSRG